MALKVKLQILLSHSLTGEPLKAIYELSNHIINYLFLLYEDVSGIPVGHLLEECDLIIDRERLKEGDPNYLYLLEDGLEYKPLDLNFEIFLDRYVMCHGQPFWEWRYYTAENYYRT